ncbi:MAG: helix-turn-helix domain-containing protein [Acidimicrobiia bacterium]
MSVSFGDSIRRGREVAGLSQSKVAALIGKAPSTVRSWELGRTSPSEASAVSALAAVLGIDEPTLLSRAGFEQPSSTPRLSLAQELEGLRHPDPTPIPPPPPKGQSKPKARPTPSVRSQRHGPPLDLIPKGIGMRPVPPLLAAATVPPEVEGRPISITVVPAPDPIPIPSDEGRRKVTMVPRMHVGTARSYVEESDQLEFYRWRAVVTVICLVLLFLGFWWALRNLGGAITDFFGSFVDALNI